MNNIKPFTFYDFISIVGCIGFIIVLYSLFPTDKYNLYDYAKRLESYNQKPKQIFISCIYCDGTGERLEDTNLIWRDAKMALWLNKHLMNDKCKDCDNKNDKYCEKVDNQHNVFLKEYETLGPKMQKTSCSECMGMGQFSSFDMKRKKYLTQEEYEKRERNKLNQNNNHKK